MTRAIGIGFVGLFCLWGICLWNFPLNPLNGATFGLLTFALVLEMSAVHLPTLGFISASFPIFFVLSFHQDGGPSVAILGVLAVLLLRSALRPSPDRKVVCYEFLVDAFSITAALVVGGLFGGVKILKIDDFPVSLLTLLACLLSYYLLQTKLFAGALQELKVRPDLYLAQTEATSIQARASAMSAPALLILVLQGPWQILWTLPVFLALYQSNWDRLSELSKARAEQNVAKVQVVRKDKVLLEAAKNMAELQSQKRLVRNCSASFAKTRNPKESFDALVSLFRDIVTLESVALTLYKEQALEPRFCKSPHRQRFFGQSVTGLRERLISKAWSTGEIQHFDPAHTKERVFEGEQHALAFPLHGQGILYVGSTSQPLAGESLQKLATVIYQFSLSLQSTLREEALARTLEQVKDANSHISLGRERLIRLLQGSHKMTQKLDAAHILEEASQTLLELFRPDFLLIEVFGFGQLTKGSNPFQDILDQAIVGLSEVSDGYYLEAFESEAGRLAFTGHQLSSEEQSLGFILMSSGQEHQFTRAQRRFLELLALHCSVMLTNSTYYSDAKKARRDLEDSQAQLVQSSKLAAVGQLAAGVAHELNTPLGSVLMSIQAADRQLEKGRYEKVKTWLEDGVKGAEAAKEIVSKLLFYSREGREDGVKVELGDIVRDTVQFLGSQISDEDIELIQELQDHCWVQANQNELQQILINLLLNARDSILESEREQGKIYIRTLLVGEQAKLSVADNGLGFVEDAVDKAFDPFFTTKPVGQGTGLGLHVSRQIAERHRGELELESHSGEGATLTLTLPRLLSEESQR